jgi:hypothetical protein
MVLGADVAARRVYAKASWLFLDLDFRALATEEIIIHNACDWRATSQEAQDRGQPFGLRRHDTALAWRQSRRGSVVGRGPTLESVVSRLDDVA